MYHFGEKALDPNPGPERGQPEVDPNIHPRVSRRFEKPNGMRYDSDLDLCPPEKGNPGSLRLNKVKSLFKDRSLAWKTEL